MKTFILVAVASLLTGSGLKAQNSFSSEAQRRPQFLLATSTRATVSLDVTRVPALRQRFAFDLQGVSLKAAITEITRRSGITIWYSDDALPRNAIVDLRAANITVAAALTDVLLDTSLDIVFSHDGTASLVKRINAVAPALVGSINGRVIDAASGEPITRAQVTVASTALGRASDDSGHYTITGVPAGDHDVTARRVGYAPLTQRISVQDGGVATVDFRLDRVATSLEAMVTTVTGEQRRVEIGNTIGVIAADSLVREAAVPKLTDVLGARIAGLQILQSSGLPGESPKIRIRGQSSAFLANDPLLYIDGVRVDNSVATFFVPGGVRPGTDFSSTASTFSYGFFSGGRINDLNPEEIESIEVVKGPSAATLYGTDAANGVILVRTKRGRAGETHWSFYGEGGTLKPGANLHKADNYFSWGRNNATGAQQQCFLAQKAAGICTIDSLTTFNTLTNPVTSPIGTGKRDQLGGQVSGGIEGFKYFVAGEYESEQSYLHMPAAESRRIQAERGGVALPDWQIHPNGFSTISARGNASASMGANAEVSISSGMVLNDLLSRRAQAFGGAYAGRGFRDATDGWGPFVGRPGEFFAVKSEERANHFTNSVQTNWRPLSWLMTRGTIGADMSGNLYEGLQRRDEGPFGSGRLGQRINIRRGISVFTIDLGSSAAFDVTPAINSRSSVGTQYFRRTESVTQVNATGLSPGAETVAGAASTIGTEGTDESVVAGAYVEQLFGWRDRLFATGALRADGGSNFGRNFKTAVYPKASVSWIVSQEPWFQGVRVVGVTRLRAAYGQSGVQPGSTDALTLILPVTALVNGVTTNGATFAAIGNPDLKPERSTELETGFETQVFENRIQIEVTRYNRLSKDALIQRPLPASVGVTTRWENIGAVRNSGWEGSVTTRVLAMTTFDWDVTLIGSVNKNRLEKLSIPGVKAIGANKCCMSREGYPLWARWDRPLLSYADANNNGIIEPSEIVVGDTAVFIGETYPPKQLTASTVLSFFGDRLRISSQLDRRAGAVGMIFTGLNRTGIGGREVNDPRAPLLDQARAQSFLKTGTWAGYMTDASFTRWREFAATYRVPSRYARRMGAKDMALTLAGRNLALWTKYPLPDPEVNSTSGNRLVVADGNSDNPTAPQTKYWIMRVNLGF